MEIMLLELSWLISDVYKTSSGFWDSDLNWHEERFVPEWFIMEDFIAGIKQRNNLRQAYWYFIQTRIILRAAELF